MNLAYHQSSLTASKSQVKRNTHVCSEDMLSGCCCSFESASFAFVKIPLSLGPNLLKISGVLSLVDIEKRWETFFESKLAESCGA